MGGFFEKRLVGLFSNVHDFNVGEVLKALTISLANLFVLEKSY
jgi:hypothetical protein